MNDKQRENLLKLKNYILNEVTDAQFEMSAYRGDIAVINNTALINHRGFKNFNACGTVGCALGWAPFALTETDEDRLAFIEKYENCGDLDFTKVSRGLFGFADAEDNIAGEYLFSNVWCGHDNTREGFACRVDTVLEHFDMFNVTGTDDE